MLEYICDGLAIFAISYLSACVGDKFKVAASRLVFPIITIAALKVMGLTFINLNFLKIFISIIFGVFFGLRFDQCALERIRKLCWPGSILIFWYLVFTYFNGTLLSRFALSTRETAYLAVIPGGIAETSIIALAYHADLAQITVFQLSRLISIVLFIPILLKIIKAKENNGQNSPVHIGSENDVPFSPSNGHDYASWAPIFILGFGGGLLGYQAGIPAGGLMGALLSVAVYINIKHVKPQPPVQILNTSMIMMGGLIGASFSRESMLNMGKLALPLLLITTIIFLGSLLLAVLYSRLYKIDLLTSILAIMPGGITPMMIIAADMEADVSIVGTLQLVRLILVVLVIPVFYSFVL